MIVSNLIKLVNCSPFSNMHYIKIYRNYCMGSHSGDLLNNIKADQSDAVLLQE